MGLLDDAIREHLDLKRRGGGDPAEIERLEREALGPVRRDPTGAAPTATAYEEPPTEYLSQYDDEQVGADVPRAEIVSSAPEPQPKRRGFFNRRSAAPSNPEPAPLESEHSSLESEPYNPIVQPPAAPRTQNGEPEPTHVTPAGEKEASSDESASDAVSPLDQPTVEHQVVHDPDEVEDQDEDDRLADVNRPADADHPTDADDRPADAKPDASSQDEDDVLEETPEFLQDTPEHDRLWFEQRPPKDFDFDG